MAAMAAAVELQLLGVTSASEQQKEEISWFKEIFQGDAACLHNFFVARGMPFAKQLLELGISGASLATMSSADVEALSLPLEHTLQLKLFLKRFQVVARSVVRAEALWKDDHFQQERVTIEVPSRCCPWKSETRHAHPPLPASSYWVTRSHLVSAAYSWTWPEVPGVPMVWTGLTVFFFFLAMVYGGISGRRGDVSPVVVLLFLVAIICGSVALVQGSRRIEVKPALTYMIQNTPLQDIHRVRLSTASEGRAEAIRTCRDFLFGYKKVEHGALPAEMELVLRNGAQVSLEVNPLTAKDGMHLIMSTATDAIRSKFGSGAADHV